MTYKILVTAQRPIALFRNLGLDFGLGLGLVNSVLKQRDGQTDGQTSAGVGNWNLDLGLALVNIFIFSTSFCFAVTHYKRFLDTGFEIKLV